MNIAELPARSHARYGERVVLRHDEQVWTSGQLRARAGRLANVLRGLGVGEGDRVAVLLPNCPDVTVAYDAIPRIGAVTVPMLFVLAPPEIAVICEGAEPQVLLTSPELVASVRAGVAGLAHPPAIVVVGDAAFEALLEAADADCAIVDRAPDDLAVVVFTGGTTGRPKGVMLTHGNLLAQVEMAAQVVRYGPDDVALGVLPMAHLFGLAGALCAFEYGYPSVVHRWFTPEAFLRAVPEHRVTITALVPTMLSLLLNHADFDATDFSSLRVVVVGAAPLPVELAAEWERRTGSTILQGYGLTETSAGSVVERPDREHRVGSCGLPYPGTEVAVLDDDGATPLAPGQTGEIAIRGPHVTPGYWRNPEATAAAFTDGWLRTGDIGHVDADGYVYITDRKKDVIIRGGLNVYPRDVEEVLYAHPAVAEAAVVGRADVQYGEQVVACVVLRGGAQVDGPALLAFCRERLAAYKTPHEVRFLEALPKSPVGKILKRELRELVRDDVPVSPA
jgi:long-chain acyl-CoA synthetase